MTNNLTDITAALKEAESTFDIILESGKTGQQYKQYVPVKKNNQLWQLVSEYGTDLKLRSGKKYRFENSRLGISTANARLTVGQLLLEAGDKLVIS